jgi:steroid delta-isomerase-like uncharacterized protein
MSNVDAKNLVVMFIEKVWNNADLAALDELTTEAYAYSLGGQPPRNKATMKQFLQSVHTAFPDWSVRIEDIAARDNIVAVRWVGEVTHQGMFNGIPATGKKISVCGINMYAIEEGKISREWEQMDSLGMLQQLGVLPSSKPQAKK